VRHSRWNFAKWIEGTMSWSAACEALAASIP
jgi:hypothetical protein